MSLCTPPALTIPEPDIDPISILLAILAALSISVPQMPSVSFPSFFCPLD